VRLLEYFEDGATRGKRLHQFEKYAIDVYGIPQSLRKLCDGRKGPKITTFAVVNALLHAAVLRIPSLNVLEDMLHDRGFRNLLGYKTKSERTRKPAFSADTMADVLDTLNVPGLQSICVDLIKQAERNKAFRDDLYGTFRCVALDGWEPFCTYNRHCEGCLTREVTIDGQKVTQYYHRFVVAFMIAPKLDMTLAIEPVRSRDLKAKYGEEDNGHEGELSAALRLLDRIAQDYGRFIDAFALDALYACGPVIKKITEHGYGAFIVTKNKRADPYRFAEEVWSLKDGPDARAQDPHTGEQVAFWELDNVTTLKTYDGSVRMLKACVKRRNGKTSTWAMAMVGKAKKAGRLMALRILRARWHIENTAFHQWLTKWNLDHCYRHTPNAINAVMLIWSIAFNLMQLFFYRRLKKPRYGRKVTDTIQAFIKSLWIQLGTFETPVPWDALDDTG
jgi:hypothetical protein